MVFPARAGMIPPVNPRVDTHPRIPRESGDDPTLCAVLAIQDQYSPRERG